MARYSWLIVPLLAVACTRPPSEDAARQALRQRIDAGNESRLRLSTFRKTDGRPAEQGGVKAYTAMFAAEAQFVSSAMYTVGDPLVSEGSQLTTAEYKAPSKGFSWNEFFAGSQGFHAARTGDRLFLSGTIDFELRESGWVPVGVQFRFSHDSSMRDMQALRGETDKVYDAYMKSDLRNLVTAQLEYFSDHNSEYAPSVAAIGSNYRSSANVTITLSNVSAKGWTATATHSASSRTCVLSLGNAAANEGEPICH